MKRILFITTRIPYPPKEGHQIRTYHLLRQLAKDYEVHLLSFCRKDERCDHIEGLKDICTGGSTFPIPLQHNRLRLVWEILISPLRRLPFVVTRYKSNELSVAIEQAIKDYHPDLIHLDMLPLGIYIKQIQGFPVVLNNHNVESLLLTRRAQATRNPLFKLFFHIQAIKLKKFEIESCSIVDRVLVCSETDQAVLTALVPEARIEVIPNGVDCEIYKPSEQKPDIRELVFVGGMGWFPNRDAINYFLAQILPELHDKDENIKLTVVGKTGDLKLPESMEGIVEFTGFVDDFRSIVHRAGIYILPIRIGSGTRLKALEAMAMGKAIVSDPVGVEGIDLQNGKDVLLASDAGSFVQGILDLVNNPELAKQLGMQARKLAVEKYDWKIIGENLSRLYAGLIYSE